MLVVAVWPVRHYAAMKLYHPILDVTIDKPDAAAVHLIREGGWEPASEDDTKTVGKKQPKEEK